MTYTEKANKLVCDDDLLDVLIVFDGGRKLQACRLFMLYAKEREKITVLGAMELLTKVHKEWNPSAYK